MKRITLESVLFPENARMPLESFVRLAGSPEGLRVQGVLAAQGHVAAWKTIGQIGRNALTSVLAVDLKEVISEAWNQLRGLRAHADPARHPAGQPGFVEILEHDAEAVLDPTIGVYLDDRKVTDFRLTLTIRMKIQALILKIEAGRVVAIEAGRCQLGVDLEAEKVEIFSRPLADVALPTLFDLGEGIPLAR